MHEFRLFVYCTFLLQVKVMAADVTGSLPISTFSRLARHLVNALRLLRWMLYFKSVYWWPSCLGWIIFCHYYVLTLTLIIILLLTIILATSSHPMTPSKLLYSLWGHHSLRVGIKEYGQDAIWHKGIRTWYKCRTN